MKKCSKLIVIEEKDKLTLKKITFSEDQLWMLAGEETLRKTWNNKYDERWNDELF